MSYADILARKQSQAEMVGFECGELPAALFGWQKDIVRESCRRGRSAIFADCGLGKTAMQLSWAQQVPGNVLVVAPLAVAQQTVREGEKFGIECEYLRSMPSNLSKVTVTNYEMLNKFDVSAFTGVVLDESSILKSYMGKTKRELTQAVSSVPFRLSCTATPSPNDILELLNQAEFLGIMKSSEALSVWFVNDQSQAGAYRLKGHAVGDFWSWVASWATALSKPSDMGYEDGGFALPELHEHDIVVKASADKANEGELFYHADLSATGFHKEKKRSLKERCEAAAEIANQGGQCLVWCYLNDESTMLKKLIPDAVEVKGSDKPDYKEQSAIDFVDGKIRVMISKPSIFGYGLNFQGCNREVFCGLDYSFESYYQAVRRVYRFGQTKPVEIYRVVGDVELSILDAIGRKRDSHDAMKESIAANVNTGRGRHFTMSATPDSIPMPSFVKERED